MTTTNVLYRAVIMSPGSAFVAGQSGNPAGTDFFVTSGRATSNNYITAPPSDDGDELDVLESRVTDAACQIEVSDGTQATAYVTGWLGDTNARWQLLGREAYVEFSTDAGTTWLLLRHGFVTDIELPRAQVYRITIGGGRRKERSTLVSQILAGLTLPHTNFKPTAPIGGPILGGLPGLQPDIGLPVFRVSYSVDGDPHGAIGLTHVSGPLPPFYEGTVISALAPNAPPELVASIKHHDAINEMVAPFFVDHPRRFATPTGTFRGIFEGLGLYLFNASNPTVLEYGPLDVGGQVWTGLAAFARVNGLMDPAKTFYAYWFTPSLGAAPAVGTQYRIALVPQVMSEKFPLYYAGHPVVVVDAAEAAVGTTLEGTSKVAAKAALGHELYHRGRLKDPSQTVEDWVQSLASFFGFAFRLAADTKEYETFLTRDRYTSSGGTIDDDTLRAIGGPTFKQSISTRRNLIRLNVVQFLPWTSALEVGRPYSLLVDLETPLPVNYEDGQEADDYGESALEYSLPGDVCLIDSTDNNAVPEPLALLDFRGAMAERIFDREGRGAPEYQFSLTGAAGVDVPLGEMVLMDTSHLPNAQPGGVPQRGGTRPGRVIRRTREPAGDVYTLKDEGSGVPYSDPFEVEFADSGTPGFVDFDLVSGGDELSAAGARLDVYVLIGDAPGGSGAFIYTANMTNFVGDSGGIDELGPFPAGPDLNFRVVAWVPGGAPSNAETPDPISPGVPITMSISSLVVVDIGTDYAILGWTVSNPEQGYWIRVSYKVATDTAWTFVNILGPFSTLAHVMGLTPNTDYDFRVELMDSFLRTYDVLTVSDTTLAGAPTQVLLTPILPQVYATTNPSGFSVPGLVGMLVTPATPFPHSIEYHVTPESAVGSGIPANWPDDVSPDPQSQAFVQTAFASTPVNHNYVDHFAANDGLLRFWRARSVQASLTPSNWTVELSVMPLFDGSGTPPIPPSTGVTIDGGIALSSGLSIIDGGVAATAGVIPVDGGTA